MALHHLAFRTRDVARLERFYTLVLGLLVLRRNQERSVWLDAAGTILMLEQREEDEPGVPANGMDLVCFGIAASERAAIEERLSNAGIAIEGRTAYSLYFRDPDGRRVGVSSYPAALA